MVTYGTTPAPFLSIRVLQQLALDEKEKYPFACSLILTSMTPFLSLTAYQMPINYTLSYAVCSMKESLIFVNGQKFKTIITFDSFRI